MNSVERTLTVLQGGIPDRVPVDLHNFMVNAQVSGMPFSEFFQNGEAMAEGQTSAWREFGHDVLLLENGAAALALGTPAEVDAKAKEAIKVLGPGGGLILGPGCVSPPSRLRLITSMRLWRRQKSMAST